MERGGHSLGYSQSLHSHSSHNHHHYGGGGRDMANTGSGLRFHVDAISNLVAPPTLVRGIYRLQGSQINVITRLN